MTYSDTLLNSNVYFNTNFYNLNTQSFYNKSLHSNDISKKKVLSSKNVSALHYTPKNEICKITNDAISLFNEVGVY